MAVTWGPLASAANSRMYAGIDVQVTGNGDGTAYYVVVRFYVRSDWNISDNMTATISGAGIGSVNVSFNMSGNPVTREVYAIDLGWQGARCGGGPTYGWSITTGGQWQGANPSHSTSWTIPPHPSWAPNPPSWNPVASSITQTSATIAWGGTSAYHCNAPDADWLQVARDAGFTQLVHESVQGGSSRGVGGLSPGTTYYMRAAIHSAAGWSGWSGTTSFRTQAGLMVKVSGTWRTATPYVKVAGAWRPAQVKVKVGGSWR